MPWLWLVLLFIAFAWSLNLTLLNWWASGGPPVEHPEIYRYRGNVFCGISLTLFLTFVAAVWRSLVDGNVGLPHEWHLMSELIGSW